MNARNRSAADALYATGYWLFEQERYRDASHAFQVMALCSPSDERAWLGLGLCHEKLEQKEVAFQMYATGCAASAPAPRCAHAASLLKRTEGAEDEADRLLELAERFAAARGAELDACLAEGRAS